MKRSAILFVGNQETRLKQSSACSVPQVGLWKIDESCAMGGKGPVQIWVFPSMVVPPFHTPKWSFLVGKPMVVGYHNFRKPPYVVKATLWRLPVGGCFFVKKWFESALVDRWQKSFMYEIILGGRDALFWLVSQALGKVWSKNSLVWTWDPQ